MSAVPLPTSRVTPLPLPGAIAPAGRHEGARLRRDEAHLPNLAPLDPVYFVGPENRLVAAAVGRLIADAAKPDTQPVVGSITLVGPTGCGKSLLTSGVASAWRQACGEEAVVSITGLDLRRQLERAIGAEREHPGAAAAIGERLGSVKLLVVDGLEGLAPSEATVRLLSETLDRLSESGGRVVVTTGKPLGEIAGLNTRTVGRLASGLTLEVAAPGEATRRELLTASLEAAGCRIEPAAAGDLAAWAPADSRRVLAISDQIAARFGVRTLIDRHRVKAFIADAMREHATTPLADIAGVVARYYSMPLRQLRSSSRKAPIVLARAVTIFLARQLTPLSYDEIGRYLGGRDHTTVMHNYNRISKRMPKERALRSAIDDLLRKLGRSDAIGATLASPEDAS